MPAKSPMHSMGPQFFQLLDGFQDGILFMDRDWRVTYINAAGLKISRITLDDLNGPTHWELFPATVGTPLEATYRRTMEEGVSLSHEFFYEPFGIWIAVRSYAVEQGIAVHYSDITRLKEAEKLRDETSARLQQVLEVTSDGILVLDRDYNITYANPRARAVLSPSGAVEGKNLYEHFPEALDARLPYLENYAAAQRGEARRFEAYYPAPLNMWFTLEALPADGGVIVFFRNETEQRANAEELRRKREEAERQMAEIETVYRTAPIGLALFEPKEFRYIRLNDRQAGFFGLKPDEILGKTLTEMAPIPGLQELFELVRDGGQVTNHLLEGSLVNSPGDHRYWTVNYSPVKGQDGTVQAISAASLEITQQKRAERALVQSEKLAAVGRLASSISHEINNPLESVTNLIYLISHAEELPEQLRDYARMAERELHRVSQIVTQTLRFHRQTAKPTPVTAGELLDGTLNFYTTRLMNQNVKLETRVRSSLAVTVLPNEIRQVLHNLLGNALDAMREGGRLLVRASDVQAGRHKGVRITVADTGHGMSKRTLARIFEPFFTTKELAGTGLGLWVSNEIVARHHGALRVRSCEDPAQHGTVFTLFLPAEGGMMENALQ